MLKDSSLNNGLEISGIRSIRDILENTADHYPENIIGFVDEEGKIREMTYGRLQELSVSLSGGLKKTGAETIILALNNNEETIIALWACFAAGIIPTILQPPVTFSSTNPALEKIINVYRKLKAPLILVSDDTKARWESGPINSDRVLSIDTIKPEAGVLSEQLVPAPNDLAFIQFSSGSTGNPKGVSLTHQNIIKNLDAIYRKIELGPWDNSLNWMPLYHDMGLIGFHLTAVLRAVNQYLIEPFDFIKNPFLWLDILSEKRISVTACPNFGQVLVNRHLQRKSHHNWDFSSIKVLFNGAEPISPAIMNSFMELLSPYSFQKKAMMPVYGLAEATLAVSFTPLNEEPSVLSFDRKKLEEEHEAVKVDADRENSIQCVSVGKAIDHCEFFIADDHYKALPENRTGQVMVRGDNITPGYYGDKESTGQAFEVPWFKTGDMGFVHEGELFITGRYKDIIFIGGKNLYAHDLEAIACRLEEVSYGKIVFGGAFDNKKGLDQVIVFLVGSPNDKTISTFIRLKQLMQNTLALTINVFVPVRSNEIPKTSSGKIQRYKLIERYLRGEFEEVIRKTEALMKM